MTAKVVVPLSGKDETELAANLKQVIAVNPDIIEWRIDSLKTYPDEQVITQLVKLIKKLSNTIPLLTTFRTFEEGGNMAVTQDQYLQLLQILSNNSEVSYLDIEISNLSEEVINKLIKQAHNAQIQVITSYHNFAETPSDAMLKNKVKQMIDAKTDIAKIAVMPKSKQDVLRLMQLSLVLSEEHQEIKMVTMAMGDLGKVTRVANSLTNSYFTFGSVDSNSQSAPGQIAVHELRKFLKILDI